jgi:CheY-like chemotaxis protein
VTAAFLRDQLNRSRAGTIIVLLDCCYSGAFVPGIRGDPDLHLGEQLRADASGRGRVVITATDAVQYAREADGSTDNKGLGGFTSALIYGLRTGEADLDADGAVSVQELFEYLEQKVRQITTEQKPRIWEFDVQGPIWVARVPQDSRPEPELQPEPEFEPRFELILIAGSDRDIIRFIEVNLRLDGFDVIIANNGKDALAKAVDLQPDLILLTNVKMPGMDGYEVCSKLRTDGRIAHIPVIIMSAERRSADKLRAFTAGADDYIIKPFDPMELLARVKATLRLVRESEARGARRAASNRAPWPFHR